MEVNGHELYALPAKEGSMTKLLLAILGLGFALAFTSTWSSSKKRMPLDETPHYALIEKVEKAERHHYSRKW
jgi:hypothetical protein